MGESVQNILDKFSKQKLFGYFLLLWGAYFFFNAISGLTYELGHTAYYGGAELALDVLVDIIGLGIGAVLAMLGFKVLGTNKGASYPPPPSAPKN
jgi:hypothetical protein